MTYRGTVKNGVVVLPAEAKLVDGTEVEITPQPLRPEDDPFLAAVQKVAKARPHWPDNYARNLDHYLYGAPKTKPSVREFAGMLADLTEEEWERFQLAVRRVTT
jgi:hypothetical protein